VEGAVLAGGASTRMGRDKAAILMDGLPLLERASRALSQCLERVCVVVRPGEPRPLPLPQIEDDHAARAPMVGVCAALQAARTDAVLVAACDMPEIQPQLVLALLALTPSRGGPEIVVPQGPDGPEPLLAVYRRSLLPTLRTRIAGDQFSLRALIRERDALRVPQTLLRRVDPELRSLRNVNRPEDLGG